MKRNKKLYETIGEQAYRLGLEYPKIPEYMRQNLRHEFYEWQQKGLENFLTYQNIRKKENEDGASHLLFNMATGTGKTLIMAALLLYYYKEGYRHFIFFVNQNNIVDKTENNFLHSNHTKYLFRDKIVIDNETVLIKKVETFSDKPQGIELKFTTIQKLYNDIHIERENQTTLDDLHNRDIVMLADEAHHLNTDTQRRVVEQMDIFGEEITKKSSTEDIERKGWEHTVIELILHKNGNGGKNFNVLVEFTATVPNNEYVARKYEDKIIYEFGLREFLSAGYTKEINLISSTLSKKERVLQALIFNWYRHKIAIKYGLANFKPVILFRSKTIDESRADYNEFIEMCNGISNDDLKFMERITQRIYQSGQVEIYEMGKSRTEQVLKYIEQEKFSYFEIAEFIRDNFAEQNVIITNSRSNKKKEEVTDEEQERLLNSLEDRDNHIRAIFTVNRLTEGWDVLNLYDIVRLYQGQNNGGKDKKTPEATIKEKQLIGRGVRYNPFNYKDTLINKRKFDNDLEHELRVLEELYYYTYDEESRYISHLKAELKKDGYIQDNKVVKTFRLKEDFIEGDFYKNIKIWENEKVENPNRRKPNLKEVTDNWDFEYKIGGLEYSEEEIDFDKVDDFHRLAMPNTKYKTIQKRIKDIERQILWKAINIRGKQQNSLFRFNNMRRELVIDSLADILGENFLGNCDLKIVTKIGQRYDEIDAKDKLNMILKVLEKVETDLDNYIEPYKGSRDFKYTSFNARFGEPKTKIIEPAKIDDSIAINNDWYILDGFSGTSEEKELIQFIKNTFGNLENKYQEIYLLRNEEVYKLFDFEKGRGFQPDFILFLKSKLKEEAIVDGLKTELYYQIFIEPKGDEYYNASTQNFKESKEGWKEDFLEEITKIYGYGKVIRSENPEYRLIGMPFFNKGHNINFEKEFRKITD